MLIERSCTDIIESKSDSCVHVLIPVASYHVFRINLCRSTTTNSYNYYDSVDALLIQGQFSAIE